MITQKHESETVQCTSCPSLSQTVTNAAAEGVHPTPGKIKHVTTALLFTMTPFSHGN